MSNVDLFVERSLQLRNSTLQYSLVTLLYFLLVAISPLGKTLPVTSYPYSMFSSILRYQATLLAKSMAFIGDSLKFDWNNIGIDLNAAGTLNSILSIQKILAHGTLLVFVVIGFIKLQQSVLRFDSTNVDVSHGVQPSVSDLKAPQAAMEEVFEDVPFSVDTASERVSQSEMPDITFQPTPSTGDSSSETSSIKPLQKVESFTSHKTANGGGLRELLFGCCIHPCAQICSLQEAEAEDASSYAPTIIDHIIPIEKPTADSKLPNISVWKTSVYMRMVNDLRHPLLKSPACPMESGVSYPFETAWFVGRFLIRVRGISEGALDRAYFAGKKRVHQMVIQGRFKERLRMDVVWGGQKFDRAWQNMPPKWLIRAGLSTAKLLNPSLQERLTDDNQPFVLFPFISSTQKVNISLDGCEPDIMSSGGISEDCSLMGEIFNSRIPSVRRRHFTNLTRLTNYYYETDYVYTFEDYQDLFDFKTYEYNLRFTMLTIWNKLIGMPLEMGCFKFQPSDLSKRSEIEDEFQKCDPEYMWRVQLWHQKCVRPDQQHQ